MPTVDSPDNRISFFQTFTDRAEPEEYEFLNDSYTGSGGYRDGRYLIPHVREEELRYKRRLFSSYYPNYVKPILDAHVNPVWRVEPSREWTNNNLFDQYMEDVDLQDRDMTNFMRRAGHFAKLHGKVFILIDNFSDLPESLEMVMAARKLPYNVLITCDRVKDYKIDHYGNMLEFAFYEQEGERTKETEKAQYKATWNNSVKRKRNIRVWTKDEWRLEDEKGVVIKQGENPLGYVPIVDYSAFDSDKFLPQSQFYQIAKMNHRLFNLSSEIQEIESNQMYPILVVPGEIPDQMAVGTGNGLRVDDESKMPQYISPSPEPIRVLMDNKRQMIIDLFSMAGLSYTQGINNLSAESKKWDYERTETMLKDFSMRSQSAEMAIAFIVQDWLDIDIGYNVQYSDEFGAASLDDELRRSLEMIELPIGATAKAEVSRKYMQKEFAFADDETQQKIEDSIDAEAETENQIGSI